MSGELQHYVITTRLAVRCRDRTPGKMNRQIGTPAMGLGGAERFLVLWIRREFREPVRIDYLGGGGSVQRGDLGIAKSYVDGFQIVFELCHFCGADNHAGNVRFGQQPSQRDLRDARPMCSADFTRLFDQLKANFFVERNEFKAGQTVLLVILPVLARVLSAEKSAGKRAQTVIPVPVACKKGTNSCSRSRPTSE
jgi:hypothetical protein